MLTFFSLHPYLIKLVLMSTLISYLLKRKTEKEKKRKEIWDAFGSPPLKQKYTNSKPKEK